MNDDGDDYGWSFWNHYCCYCGEMCSMIHCGDDVIRLIGLQTEAILPAFLAYVLDDICSQDVLSCAMLYGEKKKLE